MSAVVEMFDCVREKSVPSSSWSPIMNGTGAYLRFLTRISGEETRVVPSGRGR